MVEVGVRKQQAAQTEAELKAAAIRVFARVGYLNAKITDITAEAGRSTGLFYKHFAGKEQLLEALLGDLLTEGDENAARAEHGDDFRDRSAVHFHVASYWYFYRRYRTVMIALQQAAFVDESFAARSRAMLEPDLRHIADHLRGLSLPGDPLVSALLFGQVIHGFASAWFGGDRPVLDREPSDDEIIEMLTSFIYAGFGGGS